MEDGSFSQWASHLPALAACLAATCGPVLECGVGHNSTVVLHSLCAPAERPLLSLDGNREWLASFQHLQNDWHLLRHVQDWGALRDVGPPAGDLLKVEWDVVFVDHDCVPRGPVLDFVRGHARLVVMHDSECNYCGYSEPLRSYDWVYTHKFSPAWTTVAGMGEPPPWLHDALQPGEFGIPLPYRG